MAVAEVHVLRADVLGGARTVKKNIVGVARNQALEHVCEVLQEPALELVHAHAAGRVRRVDAGDPVDDAALADDLDHFLGDVADRQSAAGSKLRLLLEDLHLALTLLRLSAAADVRAERILRVSRASWKSKVLVAGRVGGRRLGRARVHVLGRGAATSGTAAADRDRPLHPKALVPVDRAVDLVGAGLRKRHLDGAAASGIDRGDLLVEAVALDRQRVRSRAVVDAFEDVRARLCERDRVRAELVLGLVDADGLDYPAARGRGALSGSCRRKQRCWVPPETPQPPETAATTTTTAPSRESRCVLMSRGTRLLSVRFSALGSRRGPVAQLVRAADS